MPLFKVWSLTTKKCVIAKCLDDLISSGKQKLGLKDEAITVFLEDGTEVDEDEIFQELSPGTILYLLNKNDEVGISVYKIPLSKFSLILL
jgi:hypothetical protein